MTDPSTATIRGRLTRDPEPRTAGGQPLARIGLASNGRKRDPDGQWHDEPATYWTIEAWRNLAETALANLRKGDEVLVTAHPKTSEYTAKDGRPARSTVWQATAIAIIPKRASHTAGQPTPMPAPEQGCEPGYEPDPWA